MNSIPMKSTGAYNCNNLQTINDLRVRSVMTSQTIQTMNIVTSDGSVTPTYTQQQSVSSQTTYRQASNPAPQQGYGQPQNRAPQSGYTPPQTMPTSNTIPDMFIPEFRNRIQKGQKVTLDNGQPPKIEALLGWNVTNNQCDVDVSAFMLGENGKVLGESWFVFYGQPNSPDNSTRFYPNAPKDRQKVTIDFKSLAPAVTKIVFVLTINEAVQKHLNFSMLKDAYIRIMNPATNEELVSFKMTDYYSNVISMMIGEVYLYKGQWKFNAIGNGVDRDLGGLCELYGVEVM